MKKTITIKNVTFGEGKTKVCIPVAYGKVEEILSFISSLEKVVYDVLEVRFDYFVSEYGVDSEKLGSLFAEIRSLCEKPILATFRTKKEGGECTISTNEYILLYQELIKEKLVDMIDVELFLGESVIEPLLTLAKEREIFVVMSSHDFDKTPPKEEMKCRLQRMVELGADIAKLAVMPLDKADVKELLDVTFELSEEKPGLYITMSMGKLGVASRFLGELTGSVMTFASNGKVSAPGQVSVESMHQVLDLLHIEE